MTKSQDKVWYGGVYMTSTAAQVITCWFSERTVAGDVREVKAGRCTIEQLRSLCRMAAMSTPHPPIYAAIDQYITAVEHAAQPIRIVAVNHVIEKQPRKLGFAKYSLAEFTMNLQHLMLHSLG